MVSRPAVFRRAESNHTPVIPGVFSWDPAATSAAGALCCPVHARFPSPPSPLFPSSRRPQPGPSGNQRPKRTLPLRLRVRPLLAIPQLPRHPVPGYTFDDSAIPATDGLDVPVRWHNHANLAPS